MVIWYADKWYINLFPAEKDTASNTMNKLFKTEMTKMFVKKQLSSNEEEAEDLWISSTARKQSLQPQGSNYIILYIFNLNMFLNTKKYVSRV